MQLRDNRDLLAQALGAHPVETSRYAPEPSAPTERLRVRRDFLLTQPSLTNAEAQELAKLVAVITRAEDGRRSPIKHGASGYRRGCKCPTCLDGHAERHRRQRQKRERPA